MIRIEPGTARQIFRAYQPPHARPFEDFARLNLPAATRQKPQLRGFSANCWIGSLEAEYPADGREAAPWRNDRLATLTPIGRPPRRRRNYAVPARGEGRAAQRLRARFAPQLFAGSRWKRKHLRPPPTDEDEWKTAA